MEFGISIAAAADSWKLVERAEALGFSHAWFLDTQLLNADPFVVMAASAMRTSRIRLGTGMLIPSNRIAPVTANALASLNALAPGRINFGIATGNTARRSMGLGPIKLAELDDYLRVVKGLLAKETVEWDFEGKRRKIRFLNPELNLINTTDPIDTYISALGPKSRALTARYGARWMIPVGNPARGIAMLEAMKKAWREASRDEADLYSAATGNGSVLDEGEPADSPRAVAEAGPGASMYLHDLVDVSVHGELAKAVPMDLVEAYRAVYRTYEPADERYLTSNAGHLMVVRPEERALVTAELIQRMTLTDTKAKLRESLRAMRDAGFQQFTTHVRYGQSRMLEAWADVFEGV